LKYLLGELVIGVWKPTLQVLTPLEPGMPDWPESATSLIDQLPPEADGILCRELAVERFPVGVGRYGDFLLYVPRRNILRYVEVTDSFEEYLKKFAAKRRHNLTRAVKKFLERNEEGTPFEVYTAPGEMRAFHAEALEISRHTYQSQLLQSGLPATDEFVSGMVAAAEKHQARGYLLRDDGRAIAFAWCRGRGSRLTYDVIGYLPEYAKSSPGTVLLFLILRDLFGLNTYRVFDFGPGEAQYKSMFATHQREFSDAYLFRRSSRRALLVHTHCALFRLSDRLGAILEHMGLKRRIKLLIRAWRR